MFIVADLVSLIENKNVEILNYDNVNKTGALKHLFIYLIVTWLFSINTPFLININEPWHVISKNVAF